MEKQQIIDRIKELKERNTVDIAEVENDNLDIATLETQARMKRDRADSKFVEIENRNREIDKLTIALEIIER